MSRVFYLCNWTGESGGIKVLYDHVRLLRSLGVDASLASYGKFERAAWFPSDARTTPGVSNLLERAEPDDVVVLPEFCMRDPELRNAGCRQIVFVQNPTLATGSLNEGRYEGVIVPSEQLVSWVRERFDYSGPIHLVLGLLEEEFIHEPRDPPAGRARVLLIDRTDKNRGEPEHVYTELARIPDLSVTYVRPRMSRAAFVRLFREHDVYLHLSYPEGFPVSILEAFGAGCLVIGFSGRGGLQFMQDGGNCLLVPDGDCRAVIRLVKALDRFGRDQWRAMLEEGRRTAQRFGEARALAGIRRLKGSIERTSRPLRLVRWWA